MLDLVMIIGPTSTGKSTIAQNYVNRGYQRINRDTIGGKTEGLLSYVKNAFQENKNIVLDNTHLTPDKRIPFLDIAKKFKAKARCFVMNTKIEDAQFNFCLRTIQSGIDICDMEAINASKSPNVFPPHVIFSHFKDFSYPSLEEGFDEIINVDFQRKLPEDFINKAIFLDFDNTIRTTKSGEFSPKTTGDILIMENRKETLQKYVSDGYILCGVSNQSQVHKGFISYEKAKECYDETVKLLGLNIGYRFCHHQSNPISCWCRKPMPGIGVYFINKYKLDPNRCIMVGDMKTDETFAKRCGFKFENAESFFQG